MNNDLEKEGLKFFKKIFGVDLSFEELEANLEEDTNKEIMFFFFKNIKKFFGISSKLGEVFEQNVRLDISPKEFLETIFNKIAQFSQNNPEIAEQIEQVGINFIQIFQSVDFHKKFLSLSRGNEFEDLLNKRFLEELDKAEQVNKNLVAESFKLALKYVERQQRPDNLFLKSSYFKLGIQPENLRTDTAMNLIESFLKIIFTKKQELFRLSDEDIEDYLKEFVSRFGRAIEPFLKVIIVSIYNLQKICNKRNLDDFEKGFGYYFSLRSSLQITRSEIEDYIDYRNSIKHDKGFDVFPNRDLEQIIIKFYLKREKKGRVYWKKNVEMGLEDFEKLFRDFRKFQNSFFSFYEVYIKSIDKNYQLKFSPVKIFYD